MVNLSLKRLTIASVGWKLLEKSGRAVVELAVQIVMARILAPEQFGALAVILAFVNIGNVLVQSGLNAALVQTPDMDDDDCSTVFWLSFAVSLAMYVILFLAAPFIEASFDSGEIVWPIRAIGLVFFLNSLNAVQGCYRAEKSAVAQGLQGDAQCGLSVRLPRHRACLRRHWALGSCLPAVVLCGGQLPCHVSPSRLEA